MSAYVKRTHRVSGRIGWTGPIRSIRQACRESVAWNGETLENGARAWDAEVLPSTPEIRKEVRDWRKRCAR